MLRALAWLVSNVASFLGLTINRHTRDWHAGEVEDVQLPTPNDPTRKEAHPSQPSFSGKREARIPGIPVLPTRGTTTHSHATKNQDARHKAEHDTGGVASIGAPQALILSRPRRGRLSKDECALISANRDPLFPTNVGNQEQSCRAHELEVASPNKACRQPWIPTRVGVSGEAYSLT